MFAKTEQFPFQSPGTRTQMTEQNPQHLVDEARKRVSEFVLPSGDTVRLDTQSLATSEVIALRGVAPLFYGSRPLKKDEMMFLPESVRANRDLLKLKRITVAKALAKLNNRYKATGIRFVNISEGRTGIGRYALEIGGTVMYGERDPEEIWQEIEERERAMGLMPISFFDRHPQQELRLHKKKDVDENKSKIQAPELPKREPIRILPRENQKVSLYPASRIPENEPPVSAETVRRILQNAQSPTTKFRETVLFEKE